MEVHLQILFVFCSSFREIRKNKQSNIVVGLAISLLAVLVIFIAGIDKTGNAAGCRAVALLLHYFLLSAFFWMAVEAYNLYVRLIKVFDAHISHFTVKAVAFAHGECCQCIVSACSD